MFFVNILNLINLLNILYYLYSMDCSSPLWIRNRRYHDKTRPRLPHDQAYDDHRSSLALAPWDVSRQWLCVPCGKCENCQKRIKNDWFVRLDRELARSRFEKTQSVFITITISPAYYASALDDPASFIRRWFERIRHVTGRSIKHALFQEFGSHPEFGNTPRLHFHGFLFDFPLSYNHLRSIVKDLGYIWISSATLKRARYCVKYAVKGFTVTDDQGVPFPEFCQRKYSRKFISSHVGDYLGHKLRPSYTTRTWTYHNLKSGIDYSYAIPRYYDRYLQPIEQRRREISSADGYARFSRSPLVCHILGFFKTAFALDSSLANRSTIDWARRRFRYFNSASNKMPHIDPPAWLDLDIIHAWKDLYGLSLST